MESLLASGRYRVPTEVGQAGQIIYHFTEGIRQSDVLWKQQCRQTGWQTSKLANLLPNLGVLRR